MTQDVLFGLPEVPALRKPPARAVKSTAPIKYVKSKVLAKCEDCLLVILAYLQGEIGGPPPPAARSARFKRIQGTQVQLICAEHHQIRLADEAKAERESA